MHTPFTYLVVEKSTGRAYYGVRYAKNCSPKDLGTTYFTSCKALSDKFRANVDDYFFEVRRTFKDADSAKSWEHRVIKRLNAVKSSKWFNRANGRPNCGKPGPKQTEHTEKLKNNIAKARIASVSPMAREQRSKRMTGGVAPNKGYRGLPLTEEFLRSTLHLPAHKAAKMSGVSASSILKYRKEKLGTTTLIPSL